LVDVQLLLNGLGSSSNKEKCQQATAGKVNSGLISYLAVFLAGYFITLDMIMPRIPLLTLPANVVLHAKKHHATIESN